MEIAWLEQQSDEEVKMKEEKKLVGRRKREGAGKMKMKNWRPSQEEEKEEEEEANMICARQVSVQWLTDWLTEIARDKCARALGFQPFPLLKFF